MTERHPGPAGRQGLLGFEVSDPEPVPGDLPGAALGGSTATLLVSALGAGWLPARRLTRVDPMSMLRNE